MRGPTVILWPTEDTHQKEGIMKRRHPTIGFRKAKKAEPLSEDLWPVPMLRDLRTYLHDNKAKYSVVTHSPAYTAQELAEIQHVPGKQLAKVVMVTVAGRPTMAVLPATHVVDLDRLAAVAGQPVELMTADAFEPLFPACERGAEPPFGQLWGLDVWVDTSLADSPEIVFNGGSFREAIHMAYQDYVRLTEPRVATFAKRR
jgi:Ala-tRNA(Pro) deacylase